MHGRNAQFYFDKELESKAQDLLKENKSDVFKLTHDNNSVWLKNSRETKSHLPLKITSSIFNIKGLIPVEYKTKKESLCYEVSKLQALKKGGIPVPSVIGCNEQFFILEDTGKNIRSYLKDKNISDVESENTIEKCLNILSSIHNMGNYHAGSQVKNYTIKDNIVTAIDFEDSFPSSVSINDIQYRDIFLFLVSLTGLRRDIDYKEIIEIYKRNTNNKTIDQELKQAAWKLNFLIKIVELDSIYNRASQDTLCSYNLIKGLQQL